MTHMHSHIEDQYDYYLYSLRKFTLVAFEGLLKTNNNELYRFNAVVKAAIGICKLALKTNKLGKVEREAFAKEFEEHKASEEYIALQKKYQEDLEKDDEDISMDMDPSGHQKYADLVSV